ncbi:hypothetical protein OZX69_09610 (plasmid) [Lactobacillus sp. ESL0731]|uniref:pLS20_p028 family conjugation system transmembrane protein n=1 Tax=unclassified Lactobacillus TaxID=2620435 RepID=UPI0023F9F6B8|nr:MULTISPECIES: hypothetical protein [unclassified Lactobacillus]WEV52101.1 hypothetical protein OZX63_09420 [Lactobacillus sp. ESL0700]WEV63266.1 hypothetical protein OZX69_09610 [Lactobacillus sp. ESL0731]
MLIFRLLELADVAPTNALHSALNYLNYSNIFIRAFSIMKWWIVQMIYGVANASSEFMNDMLNLSSFVNQVNGDGQVGTFMKWARELSASLVIICLIWIAIKIIVDHHAPRIKNVVVQLLISAFLITNLGTMTTWLTQQSVDFAQGLLGSTSSKIDKGTSALPFNILASHTNDLEYMIDTNFKGTNVSSANSTDKAPAKLHWGLNNLSRKKVDDGEVDFTEVLDNEKVKDGSALEKKDHPYKKGSYDKKPGTHFLYGWLKYTAENTPKQDGKGTTWDTADIWHLFGFSIGGYQRFTVNFLPVLIALVALTFAYLFAGYAIVKSFIDIVVMNILGTVIFAVDLDTGQKTKQVINSLCSAILLVSLQAFELAFYQAACTWANSSISNVWGFSIFMLAATIMLITGNDKVALFFNVDTGAQHGWRAAGSVAYGARQLGHLGAAVAGVPGKAKNKMENWGDKHNTTGSLQRAARKQAQAGSRQNAINKLAGMDSNGNKITNPNTSGSGSITDVGSTGIKQTPKAQQKAEQVQKQGEKASRESQSGHDGFAGKMASAFGAGDAMAAAEAAQRVKDDQVVDRAQQPQSDQEAPKSDSQGSSDVDPRFDVPLPSESDMPITDPGSFNENDIPPIGNGYQDMPTQSNPLSSTNFNSWKNRAKEYDTRNKLTEPNSTYSPVDYNPVTKQPYSYAEWKDDVNSVRTNDIPSRNLDGSKFNASKNLETTSMDKPVSTYAHDNLSRNSLTNDSGSTVPPRTRK